MRAADDAVHHRHGQGTRRLNERQNPARDIGIPADIGTARHPAPQVRRLRTLGRDDATAIFVAVASSGP